MIDYDDLFLGDPTLDDVLASDPETEPEPYFAGMFWDEICGELDRLEEDAWYEQQHNWYWQNIDFNDHSD